jgi:hypothetical protein
MDAPLGQEASIAFLLVDAEGREAARAAVRALVAAE